MTLMKTLPEPTEGSFLGLVNYRTSCRAYKQDPVPREHIEKMLEAARLAPSACNKQPWRFVVVTARERRLELVTHGLLPGLPMRWAFDVPVIVVLGMCRSFVTHHLAARVSGVDYSVLDVGIAGEHLVLQAAELELGTCWIGWIRPKVIRKIVGWPQDVLPQALITVGWPNDEKERSTSRLPMSDLVTWL